MPCVSDVFVWFLLIHLQRGVLEFGLGLGSLPGSPGLAADSYSLNTRVATVWGWGGPEDSLGDSEPGSTGPHWNHSL